VMFRAMTSCARFKDSGIWLPPRTTEFVFDSLLILLVAGPKPNNDLTSRSRRQTNGDMIGGPQVHGNITHAFE